jgi:hypothetical protein
VCGHSGLLEVRLAGNIIFNPFYTCGLNITKFAAWKVFA